MKDASLLTPQHVQDADSRVAFFADLWTDLQAAPVKVRFEDLCAPCQRSVKSLLEQIGKRIEGVSPDRVAKTEEEKAEAAAKKERVGAKAKKEDPAPIPAPGPRTQLAATAKAPVSRSS
jgi:hypothetical protein